MLPENELVSTKPVMSLFSKDFAEIVEHPGEIVDKTLFIKTIIEETPCKILLTAPKRFGKSTNLNMVKRFLEIEVDDKGKPKDKFKTSNYKLFKKNNLKINRDKKFFNEHLGRHPVIFINYKTLQEAKSFDSVLKRFREIQQETFLAHKYLLNVERVWLNEFNVTIFQKYINGKSDQKDMEIGFRKLSNVLYNHFGKQVFILIDEYDAFVDSLMLKKNSDMDSIISFITKVNKNLLTNNSNIDHALITGVFRLTGEGVSILGDNVEEYSFLEGHAFSTYFGLTEIELDQVLKTFVQNEAERNQTKSNIISYYNGYSTMKHNVTIYNIWSVLSYLHHEQEMATYWCRPHYLEKYKSFFKVKQIKKEILKLLSGNCLSLNFSSVLSKENLLTLRRIVVKKKYPNNSSLVALFKKIFYQSGFFTVSNEKQMGGICKYCLKIPNREVSREIAVILTKTYISQLKFNFQNIYFLHSAIDSIRQNALDEAIFENFYKSIKSLYIYGKEKTITKEDYQSVLFTFLVMEFRNTYSLGYKSNEIEFKDIFIVNKQDVAFFIEISIEEENEIKSISEIAENAFNKTITRELDLYVEPSFKDQIIGKVFIGICFGLNKKLRIAYSYLFEKDDDFKSPKFLSIRQT